MIISNSEISFYNNNKLVYYDLDTHKVYDGHGNIVDIPEVELKQALLLVKDAIKQILFEKFNCRGNI